MLYGAAVRARDKASRLFLCGLHAYVVWQCTRLVTGEKGVLADGKLIFVQTLLSFSFTFVYCNSFYVTDTTVRWCVSGYVCVYVCTVDLSKKC